LTIYNWLRRAEGWQLQNHQIFKS